MKGYCIDISHGGKYCILEGNDRPLLSLAMMAGFGQSCNDVMGELSNCSIHVYHNLIPYSHCKLVLSHLFMEITAAMMNLIASHVIKMGSSMYLMHLKLGVFC